MSDSFADVGNHPSTSLTRTIPAFCRFTSVGYCTCSSCVASLGLLRYNQIAWRIPVPSMSVSYASSRSFLRVCINCREIIDSVMLATNPAVTWKAVISAIVLCIPVRYRNNVQLYSIFNQYSVCAIEDPLASNFIWLNMSVTLLCPWDKRKDIEMLSWLGDQ